MISIYDRELKYRLKSSFFWILGIEFYLYSGMAKAEGFIGFEKTTNDIINLIPNSIQALYGFQGVDVATFEGYYAVLFTFLMVMFAIHSAIIGVGIFAEEEIDKTYEYLYTKPVSRLKVIITKIFSVLSLAILINMISYFISLPFLLTFSDRTDINIFTYTFDLQINLLFLQFLFLGISFIFVALFKQAKGLTKYVSLIIFATYFVGVFYGLLEGVNYLKYLTPFKFFQALDVINNEVDLYGFVLSITIFVLGIILLLVLQDKKEVK